MIYLNYAVVTGFDFKVAEKLARRSLELDSRAFLESSDSKIHIERSPPLVYSVCPLCEYL
jgi:hypothetical protein